MGGGQYLSKVKTLNTPAKRSVLSNTPISMNTLNTEISKLLGKATTTPISMSGLQSMLDELKANMKKFALIDLSKYGSVGSGSSKKIDVSQEYTITANTSIIGYFMAIETNYNEYRSDFGIIQLSKSNFSVTAQMHFSNKDYPATLSRNGNELYMSADRYYGFKFVAGSSYLILTDDL